MKTGRPPKPKNKVRVKPLRIPLNGEERKALDHAASRKGLATATWARMELLGIAKAGF